MRGIRRLAQHLDISIGTVSRALNGRPDVNEVTRKRVLEAAEEFGYVPNQSGRSLRQGTSNTIGFMIELNAETAANSASVQSARCILMPWPVSSTRVALSCPSQT